MENLTSHLVLSGETRKTSTPSAEPAISAAPKDVDSVTEERATKGKLVV